MDVLDGYEIILGTYEEFVVAYKLVLESGCPRLTPSFSDHAHAATVRAVGAGGKFLLTGGADETIKIFNLRGRREHGTLSHHVGALNVVRFHADGRFAITGGDDGVIAVIKTNSWRVEKTLLKHENAVTDLSVHPSGKLMLSVAKDNKLVTWNLVKGRSAFVTNIKASAEFVLWSPDGASYAVGFHRRVDVYSVATAAVVYSAAVAGRANAAVFIDAQTIAVASDSPRVEVHDFLNKELVHAFDAHETRVRCMQLVNSDLGGGESSSLSPPPSSSARQCLITASNDGFVKVWTVESLTDFKLFVAVDTKCRITCMTAHKVPEAKAGVGKSAAAAGALTDAVAGVETGESPASRAGSDEAPMKKKKRAIRIEEPPSSPPDAPPTTTPDAPTTTTAARDEKARLIVETHTDEAEGAKKRRRKKKKQSA